MNVRLFTISALFGGAVLLLFVGATPAHADIAHLRNGSTLEVIGFELKNGWIVLHLTGGGQMALPQDHVVEIRRAPVATSVLPLTAGRELPGLPPAPAIEQRNSPKPEGRAVPERGEESPSGRSPIPSDDRPALVDLATRVARDHDVDVDLVLAVIQVESGYNTRAISPKGAAGLMQLMPRTAQRFDVLDPLDPEENVTGGVLYLKELLNRYSGEVRLALAAYNAGEEAVERFGGIPPYRETIQYVERIVNQMRR